MRSLWRTRTDSSRDPVVKNTQRWTARLPVIDQDGRIRRMISEADLVVKEEWPGRRTWRR
jgi:hypothetical protein